MCLVRMSTYRLNSVGLALPHSDLAKDFDDKELRIFWYECENNTKQCYCEFFLKVWISFCKSQGKIQCWGKSPKRKFSSHVRQRHHFPQRLRPNCCGVCDSPWPNNSLQRIWGRFKRGSREFMWENTCL